MCEIWFKILFLSASWRSTHTLLSNRSPLCASMDVPCEWRSPGTCQMKYYKLNSTDCRDLTFHEKRATSGTDDPLGTVGLHSFFYNIFSFKMTAFNVTFSDITWKHMKFRFKQIGNDLKNTCREFFMQANATKSKLFYDCIWSNETYEGKPFTFEYEASSEEVKMYRKFSFRVPSAKNIDELNTHCEDWEIFTYVEAVSHSSSLGPTTFHIYWQSLPKKFLVEVYNVSILVDEGGSQELVSSENVSCSSGDECSYIYSKWYGTVQFSVQPICNKTLGFPTKTLYYKLGGETAKPFLLGVMWLAFVVPITLCLLLQLRKLKTMQRVTIVKSVPKLLIIYSPSMVEHVNVVFSMAEYLKIHCNIEPLVDELHIFSSKTRDPFKWCNDSFKSADCVMVVASPPCEKSERGTGSVYRNVDTLLLRLLREKMVSKNKSAKFFVLMLPYAKEGNIPKEARNLRRFHFPRSLDKMLSFIHGKKFIKQLLHSKIEGGMQDYKIHGRKLSNAIGEVELSIRNKWNDGNPVHDSDSDGDTGSELLTVRKQYSEGLRAVSMNKKERLKEMARSAYAEFPGNIENMKLCSDTDDDDDDHNEEAGNSVKHGFAGEISFNLAELNL